MMKLLTVVIVAICSVAVVGVSGATAADNNVFVCYFPNWAQGRPGKSNLT